jgi:transposase-like protein
VDLNDAGLVLVCQLCRWRPPNDLTMTLVATHFDVDHDSTDIRLELTAWCERCDQEMTLDRTEGTKAGGWKHHYSCGQCHRSHVVSQKPGT